MKIPVLPAVALLALLALHSTQGASLGSPEEGTTIGDYKPGTEDVSPQFLNIDKLRSAFKSDEFLNWHAIFEAFKKALPFFNWEAFPKLKGMRSVIPDAH